MELLGNIVNKGFIWQKLPGEEDVKDIDCVLAAIAYGSLINKGGLVEHCVKHKLRLDLWMRYDHTVPVAIPLLKKLLSCHKDNIFTKFIPDKIHTKVIWWKGYGAYIGSANHTDSAWNSNLELGVFFTEDDLVENGFDLELEAYFDFLQNLDVKVQIPLSQSYIDHMEHLKSLQGSSENARKAREHEQWGGPVFAVKENAREQRKARFKNEWLSTLGTLQSIGEQLADYRPEWIEEAIPIAWQVDQFLHAYYYKHVVGKNGSSHEALHKKNEKKPGSALKEEFVWWSLQKSAPSHEDLTFYGTAPLIRRLLSQEKVLSLTTDEFAQVCEATHATKDHMLKVPASAMGSSEGASLKLPERVPLFSSLILRERNSKGWDIRKLLHHVLYEGKDADIWERIYSAGKDPEFSIPRYGLNSIAEVCGWARPEVAPPRNGRTSKALYALGYPVTIH